MNEMTAKTKKELLCCLNCVSTKDQQNHQPTIITVEAKSGPWTLNLDPINDAAMADAIKKVKRCPAEVLFS